MKNNLHANPLLYKMILVFTCFMLVILYNKSKAADLPTGFPTNSRSWINFKQQAGTNQLTIRIKSGNAAIIQLFIFSLDGILIREVAVDRQKTTTIAGLKRGYYLYECFNKDQRIKSGNLVIK